MTKDFSVTWVGLEKARKDLEFFAFKAVPFAARATLNGAAFEARRLWRAQMRKQFILRNRWTADSALVAKTGTTLQIASMSAELGSKLDYLREQEEGFLRSSTGIPTSAAADQEGAQPRTALVTTPRWRTAIKLAKRPSAINRQARNFAAIRAAEKQGSRFVMLELRGGKRAIFEGSDGFSEVRNGRHAGKLIMVWDLSKRSMRVTPHPTLEDALEKLQSRLPGIGEKALLAQLRRHKVLGY